MNIRIALCSIMLLCAAEFAAAQETATPTRPQYASLSPVSFDYDEHGIRADARDALLNLVSILNANPDAAIAIIGHTDERGSPAYNDRLGRRRAQAVSSFLVSRGIAASRLRVRSAGEREPVQSGKDEAAWSQNRRVEFRVVGDQPLRLPGR